MRQDIGKRLFHATLGIVVPQLNKNTIDNPDFDCAVIVSNCNFVNIV